MINSLSPDTYKSLTLKIANSFIVLLFIYLTVAPEILSGQNRDDLESQYQIRSTTLIRYRAILDSLKRQLEISAHQIDEAKERKPADERSIQILLAQSVTIVDKIEEQQQLIARKEEELHSVRETLITRYENDLDSLRMGVKESVNDDEAEELQSELISITQKKLLIQPDPPALSFDPEKILILNVGSVSDENIKKLYVERVSAALAEIHQKRQQVVGIMREVENLNELRTLAQRFVNRSDLASGPPGSSAWMSHSGLRSNSPSVTNFDGEKSPAIPQVDAYIFMWHQLDQIPQALKSEWVVPTDSTRIYSSPQEFVALLADLDTRLSEYEQLLKQILKSAQ